ncbi:SRR1-domain-containing protein [Cristinia sonorae]|uniref:SRR1-domain-containing protein n=1 Tax=Cristinia sonorae TaxID=1940300 RepID=A0A8K0UXP4_9AGAR|nr:SRR1-domain-containing protein [Cristinia sonorae]
MASSSSASFAYDDGGGAFKPARPRKNRKTKTGCSRIPPEVALERTRQELKSGDWLRECSDLLLEPSQLLWANSPEVLCLGLGSPSSSRDARAQLVFLLEICDRISLDPSKVSVYDPVFSEEDEQLLESVSIRRLTENRAPYPLPNPTIVFMPHCDLHLYENLIHENWTTDRMSRLLLIANRLSEYVDSIPSQKLAADFPCISRLAPLLQSRPLPHCASHTTAFTNLAIQYVRPQDLPPEPGQVENKTTDDISSIATASSSSHSLAFWSLPGTSSRAEIMPVASA